MRFLITADIDVMTNSKKRNSTSIESLDRSLFFLSSDEHLMFTIWHVQRLFFEPLHKILNHGDIDMPKFY